MTQFDLTEPTTGASMVWLPPGPPEPPWCALIETHRCTPSDDLGSDDWGGAVDACWQDQTGMWVGNGEYTSEVRFCPYCGLTATPVTERLRQISSGYKRHKELSK